MRLAVLSGKGGTGKTTVAVNLALSWAPYRKTTYVDYDVEEPNGFIFLRPQIRDTSTVFLPYPEINKACTFCGKCSEACQYHALAVVGGKVLVFPELCHGCGTCGIVCPVGAVDEVERPLGKIDEGERDGLLCLQGVLKEGESLAGPVIRGLHRREKEHSSSLEEIIVADCPPGSSCSVIHSAEGSDLAILVTEPTLFGLHDLKIAVGLMREMGLDFGVIQNKDDQGTLIQEYCAQEGITLLGSIPFDLEIAKIYSRGQSLMQDRKWNDLFKTLGERIVTEVKQRKTEGEII
ncbi:ATP-binding protein [Desulfosporosinus sp. OT]|uniref:nucleotide-binding protein n=1 Tax=Desulfosporosinus sp. OT TaxID=913865 RepID=UPI000223B106|nr:ATP-binding protein [Desulfosporosinus sp. OT]EGW37526.1 4Fe-4S binding domain protein [Desulfosporosinus sp. OT]